MQVDRYRLDLVSPLHLAGRSGGVETSEPSVRSDTLFSALCVGIAATHGSAAVSELIEWFEAGEAPFLVSSTFPWAGELFLWPRPRWVPRGGPARRARWVTQTVLERLLLGDDRSTDDGEEHYLEAASLWFARDDANRLIPPTPWTESMAAPRVTVDRETSASAMYRRGRTWFRRDAGLYFLIQWRERGWEGRVNDALTYLQDSGLGGERSAGHGQFRVAAPEAVTIADAEDGPLVVTLGLYHPTRSEVDLGVLKSAAYDVDVRHGWLTTPAGQQLWRKSARFLAEGAVLTRVAPTLGDLVDVTPDDYHEHRVYRSGIALTLGAVAGLLAEPAELAAVGQV